jgi:hypothetical protein
MHHSWWHSATAGDITNWFGGWGWTAPVYYNYDPAGNVIDSSNTVAVPGNPPVANVGSQRANPVLANVDTTVGASTASTGDSSPNQSASDQTWLPLGTYAVVRGNRGGPTQMLQLAVNKAGAVSGASFDLEKGLSVPVQGSIDRATQRVAIHWADNSGLAAETGIYNLGRDKTSMLMRQGNGKPQLCSLVRLQTPSQDSPAHSPAAR